MLGLVLDVAALEPVVVGAPALVEAAGGAITLTVVGREREGVTLRVGWPVVVPAAVLPDVTGELVTAAIGIPLGPAEQADTRPTATASSAAVTDLRRWGWR